MQTSNTQRVWPRAEPVVRVGLAGAGAIVGILSTGATGMVLGASASQAALEAAQAFGSRRKQREQLYRAAVLHVAATELGIDVQQVMPSLVRDSRVEILAEHLLDSAQRTAWHAKLAVLGSMLADTSQLASDTQVSRRILETRAIDALEEPHLAVLVAAAKSRAAHLPDGFTDTASYQQLATELPDLSAYLEPIIATLTAHGLLVDVATGSWAGAEGRNYWRTTELGLRLMTTLSEAAETLAQAKDAPG